eukprot:gene25955-8296_t
MQRIRDEDHEQQLQQAGKKTADAWQPWGLVVGRTMALLRCMKGSAAAGSTELR